MKVCVSQRRGIRYFAKFINIGERDRLEVEVRLEDKDNKVVTIDLTSALLDAYADHPEIGKVHPSAEPETTLAHVPEPPKVKRSKTVSPAYLSDSDKERDALLAKVRKAQLQAAEEKRQKKAELAAARAKTLVKARKAKAEKEAASKANP